MAGGADDAWAWVRVLAARGREAETEMIRGGVATCRQARDSAQAAAAAAQNAVTEAADTADAHAVRAVARARASARRAAERYPETAVVGGTLVFCNALGALNGSLLGRAPRRAAVVALAIAAAERGPLAEKWGGAMSRSSAMLSDALKARVQSLGLLPPERD